MSKENLQTCSNEEKNSVEKISVGDTISKCIFDILLFFIVGYILFLMSIKYQTNILLIYAFIIISALWLVLSYYDIMLDKIFKYKKSLFIGCILVCFSFSSLMWYVANKNYNYGYEMHRESSYFMLIDYVQSILNSDDSFLQQKKNLKLLFSQFNAEVKIFESKNKENVIYEQNFKVDNNIFNYSLDNDFGFTLEVKKDTKEHKVYCFTFTSYKKQKLKKDLYLSALTFNLLNESDCNFDSVCVPPSIMFTLFHYINITSFWIPFFVLWIILLLCICLFIENDKEKYVGKRIRKKFHKFLTMFYFEVCNKCNNACKTKENKTLKQDGQSKKKEEKIESKEDKNI